MKVYKSKTNPFTFMEDESGGYIVLVSAKPGNSGYWQSGDHVDSIVAIDDKCYEITFDLYAKLVKEL